MSQALLQDAYIARLSAYWNERNSTIEYESRIASFIWGGPIALLLCGILIELISGWISGESAFIGALALASRVTILVISALVLYFILQLGRMVWVWVSWVQVFFFQTAFAMIAASLVMSATVEEWGYFSGTTVTRDDFSSFLLMLVYNSLVIIATLFPFFRTRNLHRSYVKHGVAKLFEVSTCYQLEACVNVALSGINARVLPSLGIEREIGANDLGYLLVRINAKTPSVVVDDDWGVLLLLPRGFILQAIMRPNIASAILAHEIGHFINGDAYLSQDIWVKRKVHIHRTFPLLAMSILLLPLEASAVDGWLDLMLLVSYKFLLPLALWHTTRSLSLLRRESEELADFVGALAVGFDQMTSAIEELGRESPHHSTPRFRVERLRELAATTEFAGEKSISDLGGSDVNGPTNAAGGSN